MTRAPLALALVATLLFGAVARAAPPDAEREMELGSASMQRRDYAAAAQHYEVARRLAPQTSGPLLGLGLALAGLDRCAEAMQVLEEYLRRKERDANPAAYTTLDSCRARGAGRMAFAGSGRVALTSDPLGAEVHEGGVGGPLLGRTPLDVVLAAGAHRLVLVAPGYEPEIRVVEVRAAQVAQLAATLRPLGWAPPADARQAGGVEGGVMGGVVGGTAPARATGTVVVHVDPPAGLQVDGGLQRMPASVHELELPAGTHAIAIDEPGWERVDRTVEVRAGRSVEERIVLVSTRPRDRRASLAIGLGVGGGLVVLGGVIAIGIIFGRPQETSFGTVRIP